MNELIPILIFLACLLATLGLVRACERLRPVSPAPRSDGGEARAQAPGREEAH